MLRLVDPYAEGKWYKFLVRGEEIQVQVRPSTNEVYEKIRVKYKRVVKERDPNTRAMVTRYEYDDESINKELIDHVLQDFKGFGDAAGKLLEVNLQTKLAVMNLPSVGNEQSIADFVFEQARELAAEKGDAITKN